MTRALSVLAAVIILLGVGWYLGHRPVGGLKKQMEEQAARFEKERGDLKQRVAVAEARGRLWAAHAELVLAADDASARNFGLAAERLERAHDMIIRAAAVPGMILPLDSVRELVETAQAALEQPEPDVAETLNRAASELNRILNRMGHA
jgi:hypothetical protein